MSICLKTFTELKFLKFKTTLDLIFHEMTKMENESQMEKNTFLKVIQKKFQQLLETARLTLSFHLESSKLQMRKTKELIEM